MFSRGMRGGGIAATLMIWGGIASHEAHAAVIGVSYAFQLSHFQNLNGPSRSPISSISGSFQLTIDTAVPDHHDPLVIKLSSVTPRTAPGSGLGFSSLARGPVAIATATDVDLSTNNFVLMIDVSNPSEPHFATCNDIYRGICRSLPGETLAEGYTTASDPTAFFLATSGTITATTGAISSDLTDVFFPLPPGTVSPVPLPASLPMAGMALLALAAAGYGLKRTTLTA